MSTYLKRKIRRLTNEISEIEETFYGLSDDLDLRAGMLERKRDDIIRSIVLQYHTAIEDMLNSILMCRILKVKRGDLGNKMRSKKAKELYGMLHGGRSMGFDMKLHLAVVHGVLTEKYLDKLAILNGLRNKCSHNWLLKATVRKGKRPKDKKPPLLKFNNRDLHQIETIKEFEKEYGAVYLALYMKYAD